MFNKTDYVLNTPKKDIRSSEKVSIIIPTLNRSDFLIRALGYYYQTGFKGYICIGDSSEHDHVQKISAFINKKEIKHNLNILYNHYPKSHYSAIDVVNEIFKLVQTPYVVFSGDDDFLITNSLAICLDFLEKNDDYVAAHGLRMDFKLDSNKAFGQIIETDFTRQHIWESEKASYRWAGYLRHAAATSYYVHRRSTFEAMLQDTQKVTCHYLGAELLPCSLTSILGKVKQIDCLSTVFEIKKAEDKNFSWEKQSIYRYMLSHDWYQSVAIVKKRIVTELAKADDVTVEEASDIFNREFCNYLINFLRWQYAIRYGSIHELLFETIGENIQEYHCLYSLITSQSWYEIIKKAREDAIKKILAQKKANNLLEAQTQYDKFLWQYLLIILTIQFQNNYKDVTIIVDDAGSKNELIDYKTRFSLKNLLNPSSPYHEDFMPIYHILQGNYEKNVAT